MISIRVPQNQDRVALFQKAKDLAAAGGARLTGSVASGSFSTARPVVQGTYETQGDFLKVTITKKPFYLPEKVIKSRLEEYFRS